jgi:hypothetical protein
VELFVPGDLRLPALVAIGLLLGFLLESLLLERAATWYYAAGAPLRPELLPHVPAKNAPTEGRHAGIHWKRIGPGMVAFWADRKERRIPTMLHGLAIERDMGAMISLDVRWSPPFTPLLAAVWLMLLGLVRGEGQITVPIGACMLVAITLLYQRGAQQAAEALRFALQQEDDDARKG